MGHGQAEGSAGDEEQPNSSSRPLTDSLQLVGAQQVLRGQASSEIGGQASNRAARATTTATCARAPPPPPLGFGMVQGGADVGSQQGRRARPVEAETSSHSPTVHDPASPRQRPYQVWVGLALTCVWGGQTAVGTVSYRRQQEPQGTLTIWRTALR